METLPTTTNAVVINEKFEMSYGQLPLPELTAGQVLIKIHSAAVNPSDVEFTKGRYPVKKTWPAAPGSEGSGLVVAAGSDEKAQALLNKKVCFFAHTLVGGSWAEYVVLNHYTVMPLPGLDYEGGANSLVNPLTAQAFIEISKDAGYTAIVHSAAASQLGRMLVVAAKQAGITLINVVRRQGHVDTLTELGAEFIVNTGEEGWEAKFTELVQTHQPGAYFDPLSGPVATQIIGLLPNGAVTYNYGGLSGKPFALTPVHTVFQDKTLKGFWLTTQLQNPTLAPRLFKGAFTALATGAFKTVITAKYPFEQFEEALEYYAKNASKGKILLQNPNF